MSGSPGQALTSAFYTSRSIKHSGFILRDYAAVCRPGDNTQHEHVQQLENKSDSVSAFNRNLCIFLLFMTCWWTDIILKQIKSLLTKPVMRFDYDLWGESKGFSCEEHLLWVQQLPLYIITVCTVQFIIHSKSPQNKSVILSVQFKFAHCLQDIEIAAVADLFDLLRLLCSVTGLQVSASFHR